MPQNDDRTEGANESRKGFPVVWIVLFLLVAYPLSIGPALVLVENDLLPENTLSLYRPIELLADRSDAVRDVFRWYVGVWWHPPPK